MPEVISRRWWALHLRMAKGESLSAEEQVFYETVRHQLERAEVLGDKGLDLRTVQAAVDSLEKERLALEARRTQLDGEIAALEAQLYRQTKHPMGIEG